MSNLDVYLEVPAGYFTVRARTTFEIAKDSALAYQFLTGDAVALVRTRPADDGSDGYKAVARSSYSPDEVTRDA